VQEDHTIDRGACLAYFPEFKYMHDIVIDDLHQQKKAGKYFPQCMGI